AELRGRSTRALGDYGSLAIRAAAGQADSDRLLGNQTAHARDGNHAIYSVVYGLHFGTYGDVALRRGIGMMAAGTGRRPGADLRIGRRGIGGMRHGRSRGQRRERGRGSKSVGDRHDR
ncbi:hypothetical protein ACQUWY_26230, partial [Ralstonia pseudosolanacearum]